jgi:hypothetical protein
MNIRRVREFNAPLRYALNVSSGNKVDGGATRLMSAFNDIVPASTNFFSIHYLLRIDYSLNLNRGTISIYHSSDSILI